MATALSCTDVPGSRDRSWGVRPVGEPSRRGAAGGAAAVLLAVGAAALRRSLQPPRAGRRRRRPARLRERLPDPAAARRRRDHPGRARPHRGRRDRPAARRRAAPGRPCCAPRPGTARSAAPCSPRWPPSRCAASATSTRSGRTACGAARPRSADRCGTSPSSIPADPQQRARPAAGARRVRRPGRGRGVRAAHDRTARPARADRPVRRPGRAVSAAGLVTDPAEVTAAWLTEALAEASGGAAVTGFERERIGTGLVGQCVRFTLDLGPPGAGPASVIGKFPSPEPKSRERGRTGGEYLREVRFYQRLAGRAGLRLPRCHLAVLDEATNDFTLLLGDLAPAVPGDQMAGCTVEQAAGDPARGRPAARRLLGRPVPGRAALPASRRVGRGGDRAACSPTSTPASSPSTPTRCRPVAPSWASGSSARCRPGRPTTAHRAACCTATSGWTT